MAAMQFVSEELLRKVAQRREGVDKDVWSLDVIRRAFSWIRKNVRKEHLGQLFSGDLRSLATDALCNHFEKSGSDEQELPSGCRATDVAVFALHVLNRLYQPLISPDIAQKLWIAAGTAVLKPQTVQSTGQTASKNSGTLAAAQYIARIAVNELRPVGAGGKCKRGDLYTLFKGIIKTLQEIANYDQARHLTPAALGGFVGPALTKVERTAATGHHGHDMSLAVTFLIHNYGPVFSEHISSKQSSFSARPQAATAHHASGGTRLTQQHVDKRGALPRHPNGPRVNLLKSVQSPGSSRPHGRSGNRRQTNYHQHLHASGMLGRDGPVEKYLAPGSVNSSEVSSRQPSRGALSRLTSPGHSRSFRPEARGEDAKPAWKPPGKAGVNSDGNRSAKQRRHHRRDMLFESIPANDVSGSGRNFFGMKSGRSTPDCSARSRGLREEHSVTSGTQTTESFFSDDEEVESAIGLVVDTCHAAIQDLGHGSSHGAHESLDKQQGCIEKARQPCASSARAHVGQASHKMVEPSYPSHQFVHGTAIQHLQGSMSEARTSHDVCSPCSPEYPADREGWTITAAAAAPSQQVAAARHVHRTLAEHATGEVSQQHAPHPASPRPQQTRACSTMRTPGGPGGPDLRRSTCAGTPGLAPPASPMLAQGPVSPPPEQLHRRTVANTTETSAAAGVRAPSGSHPHGHAAASGNMHASAYGVHEQAPRGAAARKPAHRQTYPQSHEPVPRIPVTSAPGELPAGAGAGDAALSESARAPARGTSTAGQHAAAHSGGGRATPGSPVFMQPAAPSGGLFALAQQSNSPFLSMQSPSPGRPAGSARAPVAALAPAELVPATAPAVEGFEFPRSSGLSGAGMLGSMEHSADGGAAGSAGKAAAQHAARQSSEGVELPAVGSAEGIGASVARSSDGIAAAGPAVQPAGGSEGDCALEEVWQRMPSAAAARRARQDAATASRSTPAAGRLSAACTPSLSPTCSGVPPAFMRSFSDATAMLAQFQGAPSLGRIPDAAVLAGKLAQHGEGPAAAASAETRGISVGLKGGPGTAGADGSLGGLPAAVSGAKAAVSVAPTGAAPAPAVGAPRRRSGGGGSRQTSSQGAAAAKPGGSDRGAADAAPGGTAGGRRAGADEAGARGSRTAGARHRGDPAAASRPASSHGRLVAAGEGGTAVTAAELRACEALNTTQLASGHAAASAGPLASGLVDGVGCSAVGAAPGAGMPDAGPPAGLPPADRDSSLLAQALASSSSPSELQPHTGSHALAAQTGAAHHPAHTSDAAPHGHPRHRYDDADGAELAVEGSDVSDRSSADTPDSDLGGMSATPAPEPPASPGGKADAQPALTPVTAAAPLRVLSHMHSLSRPTHALEGATPAITGLEAHGDGLEVAVSAAAGHAAAEEEVAMMLPQGVELDDLIRLAEIVTGPDGAGAAAGPTSPTELVRLVKEMMPKGAELAALMEQDAQGGAAALPAAPAVPGTSDPTANARQKAAVLAAALKGLQTPAATPAGAAPALAAALPAILPGALGLPTGAGKPAPAAPAAAEAKPPPADKPAPKPAPAPPPPPPPPKPAPAPKAPAPPPPPPPPPKKAAPMAPPPPPPPPKKGTPGGAPTPPPPPRGMRLVQPSNAQQKRLKQLHWDVVRQAEGMVWRDLAASTQLDVAELERLFKLLDNNGTKKVTKKAEEVHLVESRRAHNICIELSGVHLDVAAIRAALTTMRTEHLSTDALGVLQRAVPTANEAADIRQFLAGKHPRYRGQSDANTLGACERYFMHVMDVPQLAERLGCVLFMRNFGANITQIRSLIGLMDDAAAALRGSAAFKALLQMVLAVGNQMNSGTSKGAAQGFKLALLLKLENIKATDRKTSLLQFCIQQAADQVEGVLELPETMAPVKRAARLQVTAVDTLIAELQTGIGEAKEQVVHACGSDVAQQQAGASEDEGAEFFRTTMREFLEGAEETVAEVQAGVAATMQALRGLYDYFGEKYDGTDPVRILSLLSSFLDLYAKAVKQYQERKAREERTVKGKVAGKGSPSKEAKEQAETVTPEQAEGRTKVSVPTTGVRDAPGAVTHPARPRVAAAPRPAGVPPPPPPPPLPSSLRRPPSSAAAGAAAAGGPKPPPPPPPLPLRRAGEQPCFDADRDRSQSPLAYAAPAAPPPPPPLPPPPVGCQRPHSSLSSDAQLTPRLGSITPSPPPLALPPHAAATPVGHPPATHRHAPPPPSPAHAHPPMCDVPGAHHAQDGRTPPAPPPPAPPLPPRLGAAR